MFLLTNTEDQPTRIATVILPYDFPEAAAPTPSSTATTPNNNLHHSDVLKNAFTWVWKRGGVTRSGFTNHSQERVLAVAIRNSHWRLAAASVADGLANIRQFKGEDATREMRDRILDTVATLAIEDCAASPRLVDAVLKTLQGMHMECTAVAEQYDVVLKALVRIAVALSSCKQFKPSMFSYLAMKSNKPTILGNSTVVTFDVFRELVALKNYWAFKVIKDHCSEWDSVFMEKFWALMELMEGDDDEDAQPLRALYASKQKNNQDTCSVLQYALMQKLCTCDPPEVMETDSAVIARHLPESYTRSETKTLDALKNLRFKIDIPADSILYEEPGDVGAATAARTDAAADADLIIRIAALTHTVEPRVMKWWKPRTFSRMKKM